MKKVHAFIDADPFSYGHVLTKLEGNLTGDSRMNIALDVDAFAGQLKSIEPSLSVALWELPWLGYLYSDTVRSRLNDRSAFSMQYQVEKGMYFNESIIHDARMAHLHGQFENTVDQVGAAKKYMTIRVDEKTLAKLSYDRETQEMLQVVRRGNETQDEFQMRVEQSRVFYRVAKLDAHAFLGMLQQDLDNLDASINWLDQRVLQIPAAERWFHQARYCLGRAMEQRDNFEKAAEWYKTEGSPQEAGNRIRLRLLEKQNPSDSSSESKTKT